MKKYIKSIRSNLVYEIERQNYTETFRTPENYFTHATRNVWYSTTGFNMFVQYKGAFYMIDRTEAHGYITSLEFSPVTAEEAAAAKMERAAQAMSEAQEHEAKTAAAALEYDTETAEAEAREARFAADYAANLAINAAVLAAEAGTSDAASIADITAEYAERARRYAISAEETAEQNAAELAERAEIIAAIEDEQQRNYIEAEATAHQWTPDETAAAIDYRNAITAANRAAAALLRVYAEAIGDTITEDDPEAIAAHQVAREAIGHATATEEQRETVAAMVEAIAARWMQDHEPATLKTYTAEEARELDADTVAVITHEDARRAYDLANEAEQAIPKAHTRKRVDARTAAISKAVRESARYAVTADAAAHIAGREVEYLHCHTVNLGTSRYPDHRAQYEEGWKTLILKATASKTGKSVERIPTSYLVLVID